MSGLRLYLAGGTNGPGGTNDSTEARVAATEPGTDLICLPTGEVIDLTAGDDVLAEAVDALREHERQAREIRDAIADELRRRMDRKVSWTVHAGRFTISAPSSEPVTEYDADALDAALGVFVAAGVIDQSAKDAAVERVVTRKTKVAGVKKLKKLGGDVLAAIEACETKVERTSRPVKVTVNR